MLFLVYGLIVLRDGRTVGAFSARRSRSLHLSTGNRKMSKFVKLFVRDERGVSALEYAILAGIVVAALVAGTTTLKADVTTLFQNLTNAVHNAAS